MQLNEILMFTDIHWGKKQNSDSHNINCLNFIKFVASYIKKHPNIQGVVFLGDWFEARNAVNIATMNFAYQGAKILNDLNIPIYFIVGNHDLYTRVHRDIHSVIMYSEFSNFVLVSEPMVLPKAGEYGALLCPFLFPHEYAEMHQYNDIPVFLGHFEFQGFVVTGQSVVMAEGPSHKLFKKQKRIFSGHFHKRQEKDNIVYIGNTFPMEYGDANDNNRGFAIYNFKSDKLKFVNWTQGPQYIRINLSDLLKEGASIPEHSYVKCIVDMELNYEEYSKLRKLFTTQFKLKEFIIEEMPTTVYITEEDVDESEINTEAPEITSHDTEEIIVSSLMSVSSPTINTGRLVAIYRSLGES
jgi:DNA repair exonuclease SbcCD nuclease subunit